MSPHTPAALGQRKASPSLPRRALLALAATLACGVAMPLQAQPNASGWPAKPVKLVVGYAAGQPEALGWACNGMAAPQARVAASASRARRGRDGEALR